MKRIFLLLFCIYLSMPCLAQAAENRSDNPTPIGLEMTVATPDDLKGMSPNLMGNSNVTGGPVYELTTAALGIQGLRKATAIFSSDDRLAGIVLVFGKNDFDSLAGMIREKYEIVSEKIPFVGDKLLLAKAGNTSIELNGPHMSFETTLGYYTKAFNSAYEEQKAVKQRQQRRSTMDNI